MKYRTAIGVTVAVVLALASASTVADQGKGRGGPDDSEQQMDRGRTDKRDIYGNELMTEKELDQYRKRLANMEAEQDRAQYQYEHEQQMQERAKKQGRDLVPPGHGPIYGGELMTVEERNQYREQLRQIDSEQEQLQFQAQHRKMIDARAEALELEVEEAE